MKLIEFIEYQLRELENLDITDIEEDVKFKIN